MFEPSEHEPEEYDPEAEFYDPESDSITIPYSDDPESRLHDPQNDSITIPTVSTASTDVPAEVRHTFWSVVLIVNAAVLGVALGIMFLAFRGDAQSAVILTGGGAVLFAMAWLRYRRFMASEDDTSGLAMAASIGADSENDTRNATDSTQSTPAETDTASRHKPPRTDDEGA